MRRRGSVQLPATGAASPVNFSPCARLERADLRGADLSGVGLSGADLGGARLMDARLSKACLRRANLGGADAEGAQLRGADLQGADLRCLHLAEAELKRAVYDAHTKFPQGYDPAVHGLRTTLHAAPATTTV